ncbi:MAG TPA: gas vesicle protein [Thermoanaerobaculia bacterium]|nr:gas vesicle protein [Thermoanaerobaculia bacterium]
MKPAAIRGTLASRQHRVSLCETLDRVLNKGAVIAGDVIISIADVELLYLGVNLMLTSVETMRNWTGEAEVSR